MCARVCSISAFYRGVPRRRCRCRCRCRCPPRSPPTVRLSRHTSLSVLARARRPVIARFNDVTALQEPLGDGTDDRCFISASYDATSHFETTSDDVLDLYKRVTGTPLDMNINADSVSPDY